MMSSVISARLVFQCGHAPLVSLPRIKGETNSQRAERVAREKSAANIRVCDFCAQRLEVVVQQAAPALTPAPVPTPPPPVALPVARPVAPAVAPSVAPTEPVPLVSRRAARRNGTPPVKRVEPAAASAPAAASEPAASAPAASTAPTAPAATEAAPEPVASLPLAEWHAERVAQAKPRASAKPKAVSATNKQAVVPVAKRPVGRPRRPATPSAPTGRVAARTRSSARNGRAARSARFTVEFQVQTVLHAADMREALRQVQSLGAIEVLAITREN